MSDECPFGEGLQKYWERRKSLFSRFDEGIQIDAEGLYSVCPEALALEIAQKVRASTICDAFGGVGGNAIGFARAGKQVWSIESDASRVRMASNNAAVYGVNQKITFLLGDYFELAPTVPAQAVFLDPRWGGPNYVFKDVFHLQDFSPDGMKMLQTAFSNYEEVVLRVPRNFALEDLNIFGRAYTVEDGFSEGRLISKIVYFEKS